MDDMFLQCNRNAIYVLNTSYGYRELDMISLFGSPAGRAITEIKTSSNHNTYHVNHQFQFSMRKQKDKEKPHQSHTAFHQHLQQYSTSKPPHTNYTNNLLRQQQSPDANYNNVDKPAKSFIFKSNVIPKRTKFWKFFEEDKSKKHSKDDLSTLFSDKFRWCQQNQKLNEKHYHEAATLLGLSCEFNDSCRCLDCQSRYFDCDDSDTYSENSFSMDLDTPETSCIDNYINNNENGANSSNLNSSLTSECNQPQLFTNSNVTKSEDAFLNCETLSDLSSDDSEYEKASSEKIRNIL